MKKNFTTTTTIGSQWWNRRVRRILAHAELNGLRAIRDISADDGERAIHQLQHTFNVLRSDLAKLTEEVMTR